MDEFGIIVDEVDFFDLDVLAAILLQPIVLKDIGKELVVVKLELLGDVLDAESVVGGGEVAEVDLDIDFGLIFAEEEEGEHDDDGDDEGEVVLEDEELGVAREGKGDVGYSSLLATLSWMSQLLGHSSWGWGCPQ